MQKIHIELNKKTKKRNICLEIHLPYISTTTMTWQDQAHEELWEVSKGNLRDGDFELFAELETLGRDVKKGITINKESETIK